MTTVFDVGRVSVVRKTFLRFFSYYVVKLYDMASRPDASKSLLLHAYYEKKHEIDVECFNYALKRLRLAGLLQEGNLVYWTISSATKAARLVDLAMNAVDVD